MFRRRRTGTGWEKMDGLGYRDRAASGNTLPSGEPRRNLFLFSITCIDMKVDASAAIRPGDDSRDTIGNPHPRRGMRSSPAASRLLCEPCESAQLEYSQPRRQQSFARAPTSSMASTNSRPLSLGRAGQAHLDPRQSMFASSPLWHRCSCAVYSSRRYRRFPPRFQQRHPARLSSSADHFRPQRRNVP